MKTIKYKWTYAHETSIWLATLIIMLSWIENLLIELFILALFLCPQFIDRVISNSLQSTSYSITEIERRRLVPHTVVFSNEITAELISSLYKSIRHRESEFWVISYLSLFQIKGTTTRLLHHLFNQFFRNMGREFVERTERVCYKCAKHSSVGTFFEFIGAI